MNPVGLGTLPVTLLLALCLLGVLFGGWRLLTGLRYCLRGHGLRGCSRITGGALLGSAALVLGALLINVISYQRLTAEQHVARLHFVALAPQTYRARLQLLPQSHWQSFIIKGDEWQLDARVIKWHPLATLAGLSPLYKLDRLSGRYLQLAQARSTLPSVHALNTQPGVDLWSLARRHPHWLPLVDAHYGSSVFLPMQDQSRFDVFMTHSGLLARPAPQSPRSGFP